MDFNSLVLKLFSVKFESGLIHSKISFSIIDIPHIQNFIDTCHIYIKFNIEW